MSISERQRRLIRTAALGAFVAVGAAGYIDGLAKSEALRDEIAQAKIELSSANIDALTAQRVSESNKAVVSFIGGLAAAGVLFQSLRRKRQPA